MTENVVGWLFFFHFRCLHSWMKSSIRLRHNEGSLGKHVCLGMHTVTPWFLHDPGERCCDRDLIKDLDRKSKISVMVLVYHLPGDLQKKIEYINVFAAFEIVFSSRYISQQANLAKLTCLFSTRLQAETFAHFADMKKKLLANRNCSVLLGTFSPLT